MTTARLGVLLILAAVLTAGGWYAWSATRTTSPVDAQLRWTNRHLQTPNFSVNVRHNYLVELWYPLPPDTPKVCEYPNPCDLRPPILPISWTLSSDGKIVAHGKANAFTDDPKPWRFVTGLPLEPHMPYRLDVRSEGFGPLPAGPQHLTIRISATYNVWSAVMSCIVLIGCVIVALAGTIAIRLDRPW